MPHPKIRPLDAAEAASWPKSVIVELEKPHVDDRGSIQPLVDMPMESCVLITSKKGTVRANHYHQTDLYERPDDIVHRRLAEEFQQQAVNKVEWC